MQTTYTVKRGDTKSKLKRKFGLDYNFSGYRSQKSNELFAGEVLTFDNDAYNIDKVKSASPLKIETAQPPESVSPQAISQDPSKVGVNPNPLAAQAPQAVQAPQVAQQSPRSPLDGVTKPDAAVTELQAKRTKLEEEISNIGNKIANLPTATIEAQKRLGIFEDQKQLEGLRANLSDVKAELLVAQDRGTELLEEGKQTVSDFGGTDGDVGQLTNADLRKNNLNQLALSRTYSRLGDAVGNFQESINNSLSIINQNAAAERSKLEFDIEQKNQVLNRVIEVQGNILSSQQKAKLEEARFNNDLLLQDRKIAADQKKAILTELVKSGNLQGANLANFAGMNFSEIMTELANTSPSNSTAWLSYTREEAAGRLDKDQYDRWKEYQGLDKAGLKAKAKQEALVSATADTHNLINSILENESGLSDSVGEFRIGRVNLNPLNNAAVSKFRADAVALASVITLDTLKNLKESGATLGAVSDKELDILQTAGTRLGFIRDKNGHITGRSNLSEDAFKTQLKKIQTASLKINLANDIGAEQYKALNLENQDNQSLNDFYNAVQAGQVDLNFTPEIKDNERVDTVIGTGTATGIEQGSSLNPYGFDFVVDGGQGAPVKAPFAGRVVAVVNQYENKTGKPLADGKNQNNGWGNQVKIELEDGSQTWISHLDSVASLSVGQNITAGTVIGKQGNTGNTLGRTGVHVDITMQDKERRKLSSRQVAKLMRTKKLT